ncbi:beta-prism lectin domain-containing protein [Vibrio sp. 10N.222.54.F6]|uniref:beta-prism lectin domain-containing protein n=1 Tax=unclassified Vibrio TaxID=2614977 RepID=UPI00354B5A60
MINNFTRVCRFFLIVALVQSLFGCGQGDSDNNASDTAISNVASPVSITAEDILTSMYKGDTAVINLANSVHSSDNSPVTLQTVTTLVTNPLCDTTQIGNLNVSIEAQTSGVCVYQYSITDSANEVEQDGLLQVAMLEENATLKNLNPLTYAIESGDELTITLNGSDDLLLQPSVSLTGSGTVTSVDTQANEIQFIASNNEADAGVSRLIYSFSDDDGNLSVGNVFIAVSSTSSTYANNNVPPTFDFQHGIWSSDQESVFEYTEVKTNEEITIDLIDYLQPGLKDSDGNLIKNCAPSPSENCVYLITDSTTDPNVRYLKDADDDFLQLVDVRVFNAYAKVNAPTVLDSNDFVGSTFQFSAGTPANYVVAYTLSDHKGGLAVGLIDIKVISQLKDVYVEETESLFLSPINYQQAQDARIKTAGFVLGDGVDAISQYKQPLIMWEHAEGMCQSMGARLPTNDELAALFKQEGHIYQSDNAKWSAQESYWTSNDNSDGTAATYDLKSGQEESAELLAGKLVTCVVGGGSGMQIRIPQGGEIHAESDYQLSVEYWLGGSWINYTNSGMPWTWSTDNAPLFTVDNNGYLSTHDQHGEGYVSVYLNSDPSVSTQSGRFFIEHEIISGVYGDIRDADSKYPSVPIDGTKLAADLNSVDPQMLLRCGAIVDAFGVVNADGSHNLVGGTGGSKDDIPMLGVRNIRVEWGNYYNDKQGGGTEILSMKFDYLDGKTKECGNYNDSRNSSRTSDTFYLKDGYELIGLHLYGNRYGHAIQFYTRIMYQ